MTKSQDLFSFYQKKLLKDATKKKRLIIVSELTDAQEAENFTEYMDKGLNNRGINTNLQKRQNKKSKGQISQHQFQRYNKAWQ